MTTHETGVMRALNWSGEKVFSIDDVTFTVERGEDLYAASSREQAFVIGKSRRQLEILQGLDYEKPVKRVFDLGIYKGGSVMFYHKLFAPEKIIAIDLDQTPAEPLQTYIQQKGLDRTIRTFYGVDQADRETMQRILDVEADGQLFDLVVDDASHFLHETTASFNILFPHVAPGGYYVIEDWGWAHWKKECWQENGGPWPQDPPLTNLIFEITMLLASRPDLIESVSLLPAYAVIKRGWGKIDQSDGDFNISESYLNRGKTVTLLD